MESAKTGTPECTACAVTDSRSTPNRPFFFGKADEPAPDLHWESANFSEAATSWTRGPCIQLASMEDRCRISGAGCRYNYWDLVPGWHPRLGAVAQLGERLICIQEVAGSIPTSSTSQPNSSADGPVAQVARAHP